ncbi:MAG: VIT1/CCC1 transporter family protein [Gammaproteobacteria bacterium]|nr:VIT1/CCC1 transporter family protein [Gammaproteobacteria bacterium]
MHTREAIASRLEDGPDRIYLKDFIYGAIDGAVTTFAVVSSVAGAKLSIGIILILGAANLFADGFSMAISNFLGTRADQQMREKIRDLERDHIRRHPEGEIEEIRQIFQAKGFTGNKLDSIVEHTIADEDRWIDTMLVEEHGITLDGPDPLKAAIATFVAFAVVGAVPLVPFVINWFMPGTLASPFLASSIMTGIAFMLVGAAKSRFVIRPWYTEALETLLAGGAAAAIAYAIGYLLKGLMA